jgi:hypothetical protein
LKGSCVDVTDIASEMILLGAVGNADGDSGRLLAILEQVTDNFKQEEICSNFLFYALFSIVVS